ncbi:MAG: FG-GAP repeat protein, partial [Anaerolineae bacterium]|nr:FG-GAP repeat protein [Anaerolineae bacterium]
MAGSQVNGRFGHDVGSAGDVNGDGLQDLIIGEWRYSNGESLEERALVYQTSLQAMAEQQTVITYQRDGLNRLTEADYSGDITANYGYAYDVVGNRTSYTASLTSTVVTTYTYNDA